MVQKIEKVIAKTFYNEIFSSIERFIGRNRNQIKVLKCNLDDINFISLDDFEVRRILSTLRVNRKLKSYLQVIASVEAKGRNRYGYESEDGEIWITVSVSYLLEDGFKEFRVEGVSLTDDEQVPASEFTSDFVPIINSKSLDRISNRILTDYQPGVLESPKPLDIPSFLDSIGVQLIEAKVSPDQSIFGEIVFKTTTIEIFDEQNMPQSLEVSKGTIVVDPSIKDFRNQGSYNNTVVHEIVHWLLHKNYQECRMITESGSN